MILDAVGVCLVIVLWLLDFVLGSVVGVCLWGLCYLVVMFV